MSIINHKFMNQNNYNSTYYYKIFIGLFLLILGAILTGIATLIRDWYRLRKEKLSTAYAFKGEIKAILEIIEKRQYKKLFSEDIERKKTELKELKLNELNRQNIDDRSRLSEKEKILKLLKILTMSNLRFNINII